MNKTKCAICLGEGHKYYNCPSLRRVRDKDKRQNILDRIKKDSLDLSV